MMDIKFESREDFIYLHYETFYSLYLDLFNEPGGIEPTHGHLAKHSSGSNFIKVQNDGNLEIKDAMNMVISFEYSYTNQVSFHIGRDWDAFEIFKEGISLNDLGSIDETKGDQGDYCSSRQELDGEIF